MFEGALSRDHRAEGSIRAIDVLLSKLPEVEAFPLGAGRPPAPYIDKAAPASYLTRNPVQRREIGGFTRPFSRLLSSPSLSADLLVWRAPRRTAANPC